MKRWCIYALVLAGSIALFAAEPVWVTWIWLLTVAGAPLFSVAVSLIFTMPQDCLGLFRFPAREKQTYRQALRPYQLGDSLAQVHWKLYAKTGKLAVREELRDSKPARRRINGIVPIVLGLAVWICVFPAGRYAQQMRKLQALFTPRTQALAVFDLTAGSQSPSKQAVLDVVASRSQLLYLRGQAFDIYDGTSWRATDGKEDWSGQTEENGSMVTVSTRNVEEILYVPYYAQVTLQGGAVRNPQGLQTYTYTQCDQVSGAGNWEDCLALPRETKVWAQDVLNALFAQAQLSDGEKAEAIQRFVRSCAAYDINTPAMPENGDFVQWFAQIGRGDCVHFASLAAVLLRAAGIPARFVTGYGVSVQAFVRKTVTRADAHAWTEYWDGETWRILEATPTAQAVVLAPIRQQEKHRQQPVLWVWIFLAMAVQELGCRKSAKFGENPRIKELRQKAAFSRDGLSQEEREELFTLSRGAGVGRQDDGRGTACSEIRQRS